MRSKLAIKNIISLIILQVTTLICGFIVPKLIIQSFGSNVNGLVSSISRFLAYITLLEFGFGPVVKSVLYKPIADKNKEEIEQILKTSQKFFRNIAYIFIGYIIVLCLLIPRIVAKEFDILFSLPLIIIISMSIFSEYYFGMTYKLFLHAKQRAYITSLIQIITLIINTIITVLLIKFGASIQLVKLSSAIIFISRPILQNLYVKKKYNIDLKHVSSDYTIEKKWDGLVQHIAYVIHSNTDVIILTIFSTMSEISVYSVYAMVVTSIKSFIQSITGGMDATFGDIIAKNEKEILNKKFRLYEIVYFSIITIVFSSTLFLLMPFISVYTKGIKDADYIRPVFSYLIVLGEFFWAIRLPYSSITLSSGYFKETQRGAWGEAISNIVVSLALVPKYGIVGVAIGTLVAMIIRTVEYMYLSTKLILDRKVFDTLKYLLIMIIEVLIITAIQIILPNILVNSYISWIIKAIEITLISSLVVLTINGIIYKKYINQIIDFIRLLFKASK